MRWNTKKNNFCLFTYQQLGNQNWLLCAIDFLQSSFAQCTIIESAYDILVVVVVSASKANNPTNYNAAPLLLWMRMIYF